MGFEVCAIITPKAGKEQQVRDGLTSLAQHVKDNEPGATKYQVYEQTNADGTNDFIVEEEYVDKAAFDHHVSTDTFKALGEAIQKDDLLAKPLDIKFINKLAGYASR